jgi:PAS domain S-box-containing protein
VRTPSEQASEERQLALLVSSAVDYAIFVLDTDGHVLTWNVGAERMKGYTRDEIVGRHFSVFYPAEDVARDHPAEELRLAAAHGRYEEEGWRVRKDGSRFWANVVITAIREDGELVGFGKLSRDLTKRRLAEERSRARSAEVEAANAELAEYRRLVTSVRDYAIFMLDPDGRIRSWNRGARELKGYEPEEVIGRHFSVFYTDEDRARDHPDAELEIAGREGRYEEEGWRVRKDGTTFWASVTITAVRDDDGRLTGFAKVTRDLTVRKRAEEALRRAVDELRQVNAELDRFASFAAHDMTGPLSTIAGFAALLLRAELPPAAAEYAAHIAASSERLSQMLDGLLAYARSGGTRDVAEPVDLARVTEQVLADLAVPIAERDVCVAVEVPAGAFVMAGERDVRLVLQNLIANAVKFADADRPHVTVAAQDPGDGTWRTTVQDDGRGIAAADRERIFRAFERAGEKADRPGHGLGLAICQRLIDRHHGTIGVLSEPGQGSSFWFALPAAGAGAAAG